MVVVPFCRLILMARPSNRKFSYYRGRCRSGSARSHENMAADTVEEIAGTTRTRFRDSDDSQQANGEKESCIVCPLWITEFPVSANFIVREPTLRHTFTRMCHDVIGWLLTGFYTIFRVFFFWVEINHRARREAYPECVECEVRYSWNI